MKLEPVMTAPCHRIYMQHHMNTGCVALCACVHHVMFDMSTCGVSVMGNTERLRDTARGA